MRQPAENPPDAARPPLDLAVDPAEEERVLAPYLGREVAADDPEWRRQVERLEAKWTRAARRRRWLGWLPAARRGQRDVQASYERQWGGTTAAEIVVAEEPATPFLWHGRRFLGPSRGIKRLQVLWLMTVVERLRPASLLEVGCGTGTNLALLAARFPAVRCAGIELTREGVEGFERLRQAGALPATLAAFSPLPPREPEALARVEVRLGSAAALPYPDGAFDLVVTVQALEQMEAIREQALAEIARVAGRATAMIEPFRDWNEDGVRRARILAHDYFAARIAELPRHGLEPVFAGAGLPAKVGLGVDLVVCAKAA